MALLDFVVHDIDGQIDKDDKKIYFIAFKDKQAY